MTDADLRLDREEIVEQAVRAVQVGRLAVVLAEQSVSAGLLGDAAVMLMEAGVDVARLDAFESHSPDAIRQLLCRALELDERTLIEGLRFRGESGNPFCLVIDSAECLDSKAFILLKTLLEQTSGGLGVLLAGEPDLDGFIAEFGLAVAWRYELEPDFPLASEPVEDDDPPAFSLPWKHLAAAAGLALLVVLFWPDDEPPAQAQVRPLALPERPGPTVSAPADERRAERFDVSGALATREPRSSATTPTASEPRDAGSGTPPATTSDAPVADEAPRDGARTAAQQGAAPAPAPADASPDPAPTREAPAREPAPNSAEAPARAGATVAARDPRLKGLDAELTYRREDWLLAQDADRWLLQVALAATEDGARSLLDRIGTGQAAYYRAQRDGRSVYVVVTGPWADRKAAVASRDALPADLRRLGPFPRQLRAVQGEIAP